MNYLLDRWMENIWPSIKDVDIRKVKIPGSHDSGAFSALNTIFVRDQSLDIGSQLNAGIRYLDLRVTQSWWDPNFYTMYHETYPADVSQSFNNALQQIAAFIAAHPYEFVVVNLRIKSGDPVVIPCAAINTFLGPFLLQSETLYKNKTLTPAMLKDMGRRVILLVEDFLAPLDPHYISVSGGYISSWTGDQQDPGKVKEEQARIARESIERTVVSRDWLKFTSADAYIYGLNNRQQEEWLHTQIPGWLSDWKLNVYMLNALNIIQIDFAGIDDIVSQIIGLNDQLLWDFDGFFYLMEYPDIQNASGLNNFSIVGHWCTYGIQEGRRGSQGFDVQYYLAAYPDLKAAFGTNYRAAFNHWVTQGLPVEGRRGCREFDVQYYLEIYPDIREKYGSSGK